MVIREDSPYHTDQHLVYGSVLWDSGLALSKYFAWGGGRVAGSWRGRRVLDLGTGTGVVALTLAKLGAEVTATDCEPGVIGLLERNIEANGLAGHMTTHCLDWGDRASYLGDRSFDVVVAADVLYSRRDRWFWRALHSHMDRKLSTIAYVASPYRQDSPLAGFFGMASEAGLCVERLEDGGGRAAGGAVGQPEDVYEGSRFVALTAQGRRAAAESAEFGAHNVQRVQIFRLSWPDSLGETP